jgi:hypothetical protein
MTGGDLFELAHTGTDAEWYAATGACGGCGDAACHDGPCSPGEVCTKCPNRKAQGLA